MTSEAMRRLGEVSRTYQTAAIEYEGVAVKAANAEADYKSARAKAILVAKADGDKMSHAEAETRAEADDRIAELYRERLVTAALADAAKQRLGQLKEQVAVGRSAVTSERMVDQLHAEGVASA